MSDSLNKIYEDYESYEILCKKWNINCLPLNSGGEWFKHYNELEIELKLKSKEYENVTRLTNRIN